MDAPSGHHFTARESSNSYQAKRSRKENWVGLARSKSTDGGY